jgi:glucose-6-phosphate 1-dehydrogenase
MAIDARRLCVSPFGHVQFCGERAGIARYHLPRGAPALRRPVVESSAQRQTAGEFVPVDAFDIVVFGATGDLAMRKLLPALFHRWRDRQVPQGARIIATARAEMTTPAFRDMAMAACVEHNPGEAFDPAQLATFFALVDYHTLDAGELSDDWAGLAALLDPNPDKIRLFYLALPPGLFGPVCANIAANGLKTENTRIVLEKPIGANLESARAINDAVGRAFPEKAIFRIDHYLGKETVQNLLILRFANAMFEPVWNARGIDHVQITVAETLGAGKRASYYDGAGALRDMVQNHLLQLLCLVAMEPPLDLDADSVRDEKLKVLRALKPITPANVRDVTVRGQYRAGGISGAHAPSYVEELGRDSDTETFVAIKAEIENWRWSGVPFYLRTGKRMSGRRSEIIIQFKDVPHVLTGAAAGALQPNRLVLRLQPDEAVRLMLMTKEPGPGALQLRYVPLNLSYADTFKARYPDAYERLLIGVLRGNLGLFMRRDEVEAAWSWVDGILGAWAADKTPVHKYAAGADGPAAADVMIADGKRSWYEET